jgi:malonyl-ACP decarboxylase
MKNHKQNDIFITGIGVTSAIGQGKSAFTSALLNGHHAFDVMRRPGRQIPLSSKINDRDKEAMTGFLGAEIDKLQLPDTFPHKVLRTASFSGQVALATLYEAWHDAGLYEVDSHRIGLVVGGSNFQQRELITVHESYKDRYHFLRPTYGISFMDSDLCGLCTEIFGIRGFAYTIGGASASGQLSVIKAIEAIQSGQVDICIAMGALMDLSFWECLGFRSLGAMGSNRYANEPARACRPFDQDRDGFIYGESCGVVVIEGAVPKKRKLVEPYGRVTGWAIGNDGNRNPNPSLEGEIKVIKKSLKRAQLLPEDIDYINPHGTGSGIGDEIEIQAIKQSELNHAYLNATKSITGHGLSSAGTVEIIATLVQMESEQLHPTRNLENPIEPSCNWVKSRPTSHQIENALNISIGFGGINSAVCIAGCG